MSITLSYPGWFLLLCLLAGTIYAAALYWKNKQINDETKTDRILKILLATLRFFAISFIVFLLLSPYVKSKFNVIERPLIVIAQDNSKSMLLDLKREDSLQWISKMEDLIHQLEAKYEVRSFHFGNTLKPGFLFHPEEPSTDLSTVFSSIMNRFGNRHIGAIVMATDGIINQGLDPVAAHRLPDVPVFTIGMGDTIAKKDIQISAIQVNQIVYLHDIFEIEASIKSNHALGEKTIATLSLIEGGKSKTLSRQSIQFNEDPDYKKLYFKTEAIHPGLHHYRISLNGVSGEISQQNNVKDFFVDVLDSRVKILILAASPHPDIAAIKHALSLNKNYRIDIKMLSDFRDKLNTYDILIAYQLPALGRGSAQLLNMLRTRKKATWFILGSQSDISAFNQVQQVLNITNNRGNTDEASALVNKNFSSFKLPEAIDKINYYPPLNIPFGQYKAGLQAEIIFKQKLGKIATDNPLLMIANGADARIAVLCGTGLWKWRLFEYARTKSSQMIDQVIRQVVQFLSVRNDKRKFRIDLRKNLYNEGESVMIDAYLYDDNYALTNDPELSIDITDSSGKVYQFLMNREQHYYTLNAGKFPEGDYRIEATVKVNKRILKAEARYSVVRLQVENLNTVANHMLLHQISNATGGTFYLPDELSKLSNQLINNTAAKPRISTHTSTLPLINLKWIFFLLVSLLTLEWFVRKWRGAY